MKFYLTGPNSYTKDLNNKIAELRDFGYTVTHRWIKTKNPSDGHKKVSRMISNIQTADNIILFFNSNDYEGALNDISCALGANKKVVIICTDPADQEIIETLAEKTPLLRHPSVNVVESWQTFLTELVLHNL